MLGAIRKHSSGIVVKALLFLLILSFAAWGIGDVFNAATQDAPVASVGDHEITPNQFISELQREVVRLRPVLGDDFDLQKARQMGVSNSVLGRMVSTSLYDQGAKGLGILVSDPVISHEIQTNPEFFNTVGSFDRFTFEQVLRNNDLTEAFYVERVRRNIARFHYLGITDTPFLFADEMLQTLYKHQSEKRVLEITRIDDSAVKNIATPSDSDLKTFHSDNADRFTAPEYRALTLAMLQLGKVAEGIDVSDDEINTAYENRAGEFIAPERRQIQQMLFDSEEQAKAAKAQLDAGADFAKVAKDIAGMDASMLELGTFTQLQMLPELANAAFTTPQSANSAPVKSTIGWHILRVVKVHPSSTITLDKVKDRLVNDIKHDKAVDAIYELSNHLEDALGGGATLEEAAHAVGVDVVRITSVDARGIAPDGKPAKGLPKETRALLGSAFSTDQGMESPLGELGNEGFFIVRVDGITPSALRPLESVKQDVTNAWTQERRAETAAKLAQDIRQAVLDGATLASAAGKAGFKIETTKPVQRPNDNMNQNAPTNTTLPPSVLQAAFDTQAGETFTARAGNASFVGRVQRIVESAVDKNAPAYKQLGADTARAVRNDLVDQMGAALRLRYPVQINQASIDNSF